MNRFIRSKSLAAAAVALCAFAGASVAHARSDVYFSIGLEAPGVYVQPAPVYVQPQPVYVQPRTVYVQPQPVYEYRYEDDDRGRYGHYDRAQWRHQRFASRFGPYGDRDRDGVPNRYDRFPENPTRR